MDIFKIPYSSTNYFSKLIIDYIDQNQNIESFINHFPNIDEFSKQMHEKSKQNLNRDLLVSVLESQNSQIKLSTSSNRNIELLKKSNTFTITTGHQLCLFTGPLYFIYKVISSINLAEQLSKKYLNNNFVPVFWMASEDHDFQEINHVNIFGKKIEWNHNNLEGPVGKMNLNGIDKFIRELEDIFRGEIDDVSNLLNSFKEFYMHSTNLSEATRKLINSLFGKYGIVIIDANDKKLKNQFASVIKKDVISKGFVRPITDTSQDIDRLYNRQAFVRDINFFMLSDNSRVLINTNVKEDFIDKFPEKFSPNVLLRPLYQEYILPNVGVVGGASEISYWLQLKSAFIQEKIPFPILVLRNSAMIMSDRSLKRIKSFHFNISDIFYDEHILHDKYIRSISKEDFSLRSSKEDITNVYTLIINKIQDVGLKNSIKAALTKHLNNLEKIESKIVRLEKKRNQDAINQISKLKDQLFPNSKLQERVVNFLEFYLKDGDNFIEILKDNLNPLDPNFVILAY